MALDDRVTPLVQAAPTVSGLQPAQLWDEVVAAHQWTTSSSHQLMQATLLAAVGPAGAGAARLSTCKASGGVVPWVAEPEPVGDEPL